MAIDLPPEGVEKTGNNDVMAQLNELLQAGQSVTAKDRMFFTEQLILLLETGASLHEALQTLEKQAAKRPMRELLHTLSEEITEGRSFSVALSRHPKIFSETYVKLISASEAGGFMAKVLDELLEMEKKQDELISTVKSAFSYPAFLMVFSVFVVIFVLISIFPKFAVMFAGIRDNLPGSTLMFMSLSEILIEDWPYILAGAAVIITGIVLWVKSEQGKMLFDRAKLRTPLLRHIFIEMYMTQALRVMGLSLSAGVSVPDTLQSCRGVVNNADFRAMLDDVEQNVLAGKGIAAGFEASPIVPDLVKHMIDTGEQSGNLAKVMTRIADYYERELQRRLESLSKMAEPLMLVIMGVVVGGLVSSLILPIFQLSSGGG